MVPRMVLLVLDDFVPYRLSVASNLVSDSIARTYEALFGLSIAEWRVIAVAAEQQRTTQADISVRTRMDKVTVSRAARALVTRRLLTRTTHDDQRSRWLELTSTGLTLYAAVAPKALELEKRLFARFTAGELLDLKAMLRRIEAAALTIDAPEPCAPDSA